MGSKFWINKSGKNISLVITVLMQSHVDSFFGLLWPKRSVVVSWLSDFLKGKASQESSWHTHKSAGHTSDIEIVDWSILESSWVRAVFRVNLTCECAVCLVLYCGCAWYNLDLIQTEIVNKRITVCDLWTWRSICILIFFLKIGQIWKR